MGSDLRTYHRRPARAYVASATPDLPAQWRIFAREVDGAGRLIGHAVKCIDGPSGKVAWVAHPCYKGEDPSRDHCLSATTWGATGDHFTAPGSRYHFRTRDAAARALVRFAAAVGKGRAIRHV